MGWGGLGVRGWGGNNVHVRNQNRTAVPAADLQRCRTADPRNIQVLQNAAEHELNIN